MKIFLFVFMMHVFHVYSQQHYEYVYRNPSDSTYNCYLKMFPETEAIQGLVIRDYSTLPDASKSSPYRFQELCAKAGLMTVYTVSSPIFPELYYDESPLYLLDELITEIIKSHGIPENKIFIGGISASGTRALRYAQFCEEGKSAAGIKIKGVFAVDSPLDLERFYTSVFTHKNNFKEGMLWEADLMSEVFPLKMKGSPLQFPEVYQNNSVFSHSAGNGGNAIYLKDVNLIMFHEPDISWWITERGSGYFDINSFDIAALFVLLNKWKSTRAELITTTGKGYDLKGNRNCHSWSIVDEEYLVKWILSRK